jgi:hypothetical protein
MKRLNKITAIMSLVMVTAITAQDIAGDYNLNGVLVRYTGLSRETVPTQVNAFDVYGIGVGFTLAQFNPMDAMYSTVNGPLPASMLDFIGVSLDISLYADGTGAIHEGSTYPTVQLDAESCVTSTTVLPVTDYLEYTSDLGAGLSGPAINILGMPAIGPHVGEDMGSMSLSVSDVFDYFPAVPTYIDLNGDGVPDLPGTAGGFAKTTGLAPWLFDPMTGGYQDAGDVYIEWHAIDGPISVSGFGDIDYPEDGWDEDEDGSPIDRIVGIGPLTCSSISPYCVPGLNYPIVGDLSGTFPEGCVEITSASDFYIMDPGLTDLTGGFVTMNAVYYLMGYGFFGNDSDHDFDGVDGRLAFNHAGQCIRDLQTREVYIDFLEEGSDIAGDANLDGQVNVLDVVTVVAHILGTDSLEGDGFTNGDMDGDGDINVLDVVMVVDAILNGRVTDNATAAMINKAGETVKIESNGFVGAVQMTLTHGDNFSIDMTTEAMVADYNTVGNTTTLIVVAPEAELFTATGNFTIDEVIAATTDGYVDVEINTPSEYSISSAYPNPFNPTTNLTLDLNIDSDVNVKVFNLMGQLMDVLVDEQMSAGSYSVTWNASSAPSGMYFVKTEVGSNTTVQKIMLLK